MALLCVTGTPRDEAHGASRGRTSSRCRGKAALRLTSPGWSWDVGPHLSACTCCLTWSSQRLREVGVDLLVSRRTRNCGHCATEEWNDVPKAHAVSPPAVTIWRSLCCHDSVILLWLPPPQTCWTVLCWTTVVVLCRPLLLVLGPFGYGLLPFESLSFRWSYSV